MSELITTRRRNTRWHLLTTVSAIALISTVADVHAAYLTDSDHPPLWIELGGDFEKLQGQSEAWVPPAGGSSLGDAAFIRKDPTGSFGLEGKVSYQLDSWIMSVSARYGRAQRDQSFHTQTGLLAHGGRAYYYNAVTRHTENHLIADFQIGKDVGLGMWGRDGQSQVSVGVKIAQFNASNVELASSNPVNFSSLLNKDSYLHKARIERRTSVLGPSISWDGSVSLVPTNNGHLNLDWGAGGALLFGKQEYSAQISSNYVHYSPHSDGTPLSIIRRSNEAEPFRHRSKLIPNLTAFAGVSYRLSATKLAIGYRADLYLNAMDGGVTAAHSINRSFYGPFATISVGIGG